MRPTLRECRNGGRVLAQRKMGPDLVVVTGVGLVDSAQVRFAENYDLVQTLAAGRTNQPFGVTIVLGRARRDGTIADAHRTKAPGVRRPERFVADQMTWCFAPRKGFTRQ